LATSQAAWAEKTADASFIRPSKSLFAQVPADSIDYAVMEKCPQSTFPIKMVPMNAGWSDLGAWDAVWQVAHDALQDPHGNVTQGDTLMVDTTHTLIHATSRLVASVGVTDLIIVETPDAVLVMDRSQSQNVKKIVQQLDLQKRPELNLHRKVNRPWGWYDSIDEGERFKVKRIQVNPGASLSLQKHHHRAEHWVVVKGTAEITNADQVILLTENQSTYIPLGEVHRLSNPGTIPLEIIEVQSGSYLGEDDIVRFEDTYGRN
jgi:mannose-1-phosphate guanylyltransferase/mannose-6-phosphate isomerase